MKSYAIGIDLGGTNIKALAVTVRGEILFKVHVPFDAGERMDWAKRIRDIVQQAQREAECPATCIGLSAPGLAARDGGSIAYMPGRLQGLEGFNWTEFLHRSKPVRVLNDAHAALFGEAWIGAARGFQNVIMLTLGTGVGGAAMVEGKLLRGAIGRAGHLGHTCLDPNGPRDVCGTPGSMEFAIGNYSLKDRSAGRFETTQDLISAHAAGDAQASAIWLKSVQILACAICSFTNILDPEAVIIGGGIARAGKSLFDPLQEYLDPIEWRPGGDRVKILPAVLGEFAGAYGAARNAFG
jgi:glucokinase